MYGTETTATSALAITGLGLATGAWVLAGICLVLAGASIYLLFRKESAVKP